jgi:hypothetical protein
VTSVYFWQVLHPPCDVQPSRLGSVHSADLQVIVEHAEVPTWQVRLQAHDPAQLMLLHESRPPQSMLQGPGPHVKFAQLSRPAQLIVQDLAPLQLMPARHELPIEHAMLQLQPLGQVTGRLHAPALSAQSIVQVFASVLHDVH